MLTVLTRCISPTLGWLFHRPLTGHRSQWILRSKMSTETAVGQPHRHQVVHADALHTAYTIQLPRHRLDSALHLVYGYPGDAIYPVQLGIFLGYPPLRTNRRYLLSTSPRRAEGVKVTSNRCRSVAVPSSCPTVPGRRAPGIGTRLVAACAAMAILDGHDHDAAAMPKTSAISCRCHIKVR